MTDQHAKSTVNTVKGSAKEGVGKMTGDKTLEARGKAQKVQGKAQGTMAKTSDKLSR